MPDIITKRLDQNAPQMSEADFAKHVQGLGERTQPKMEFYTRLNVIAPDADRARGAFVVEIDKMKSDVDVIVWRRMPFVGTRRSGAVTEWVAAAEFMVAPR